MSEKEGIIVKVTTRSAGNMYADAAQGEECWFVTPSSGGGVEVAHVFRIHFHYKPTFVAGKIEKAMTDS